MEKGGQKAAAKFLDALVKSVQSLCHGYLDFQNGIEIVGFINLSVDKENSVDCVLKEKVCKTAENATSFISNSYHAKPVSEEAPSGNCHKSGKQTVPSSNSPPPNRSNSEARDSSQFSHPSRGSLKRKVLEDHRGEPSPKKTSFHPSNRHHSSSENLHGGSLVSVDSLETEQAESAVGGSRSPDNMDQVKLTGSGIVLEPVDDQGCAGEESSDFDVTFIKEEFVEDESEFDSSANSQHLAGDQYRRGQNSTAPFCPISSSSVDLANAFKVEPAEHHDSQGIPTFQPHPGSSGMAEFPRSYQQVQPDSQARNRQHLPSFHQQTVSSYHPEIASNSNSLHCPVCSLRFTSTWERSQHKCSSMLMKNGQHICNICGKGITRKEDFEDHLNKHRNIKAHACPYCSQPFTYKNNLRQHIRSGVCQKYGSSVFFRNK